MFSFFSSKKVAPKPTVEVVKITTFPVTVKPKKTVRISEDKNDTILFQDVNAFIGYNSHDRHPFTGFRVTRLSRSGKISVVHVLPNGSLMEMRFGHVLPNDTLMKMKFGQTQTYSQQRRIFPSYSHWMNFLMTH